MRDVFRLGVALAYTSVLAGLGQCIIARIEILAILGRVDIEIMRK